MPYNLGVNNVHVDKTLLIFREC